MSKRLPFPEVPTVLIDELEARFPDTLPEKPMDKAEYDFRVGQQSIVRFLRREFDKQNNPKD